MALNRSYTPTPSIKAGFFGLEKRGKTHGACSLVVAAYRDLGLQGDIACIATENWVDDWHSRLAKATGRRIVPCFTRDPNEALAFAKECEKDGGISFMVIDSASQLIEFHRQKWLAEKGRGPKAGDYIITDAPFKRFVLWAEDTKINWAATMREDDDRQEVDENEIIVGKKAKGHFGYVPRLMVHCQVAKPKGGQTDFRWHIRDCGSNEAVHVSNAKSDVWTPFLERYKVPAAQSSQEPSD